MTASISGKQPSFRIAGAPAELQRGLAEIALDHPQRLQGGAGSIPVVFKRDSNCGIDGLAIDTVAGDVVIRYGSRACAYRALGRLLSESAADLRRLRVVETASLTMRGLMIDCSRNAVMRPETLQAFMRRVALMGVNMIMLYTEDTYEVPGEPFFGYLRGRYTQKELKALDTYAFALGIEMIPCIQTLGHFEQILQWDPYFPLRDTPNILLAGEPKTYEFIRKIIRAASAPFRTRRIHLGMDEAHGLGTGAYRRKNGQRRTFDIMNEHLAQVRDICRQEGLKPMIWSDMYFRLGSATHDYYDLQWKIPADAVKNIPRDVQLVYWDYYHDQPEFYQKMIAFHRKLGSEPLMGGGIWTWGIQWCALHWSFTAIQACLTASRREGLKEVFMTLWGDDGTECDYFSALPGIQYFCELAFDPAADRAQTATRFRGICGCDMNAWFKAADINTVPLVPNPALSYNNIAKGLLWQDPLLPLFEKHLEDPRMTPHYRALSAELARAAGKGGLAARLTYPLLIARVLAVKTDLHRHLAAAYRAGDRARLRALLKGDVRATRKAVAALWKHHRALWMDNNKPFGWEVLEHRYGGLMTRLATLEDRLTDFLGGRLDAIPELAAPILDPWAYMRKDHKLAHASHAAAKTPSYIK